MISRNFTVAIFFVFAFLGAEAVLAGDLDDGISKYTDDSVQKYDDLGKSDRNIKFIVLRAKSKAAQKKDEKGKKGKTNIADGDANMNSVIMGAGSNVRGDIIIIDQGKGDRTNVSQ